MKLLCTIYLIICLTASASGILAQERPLPKPLYGVHRIVFLGDSITWAGGYIEEVELTLATQFPDNKIEILNLGLPSETVSGLTEPNHAGGAFPRPDLHERLDRVLAKTKPDLVIACYGMNDGIYYPLSEERFRAYREGIQKLRDKVLAAGAKLWLLTPPTFDSLPIKSSTLPARRDVYPSGQPFAGYDDVLAEYSRWLVSKRRNGWDVVGRSQGASLSHRRKA
jgi:Lysophospholipase L1 and related esterases